MQERWKIAAGFPWYEVSSHGRIRRAGTGRMLRLPTNTSGYFHIGLYREEGRKHVLVNRLVLLTFLGPQPTGKQCSHKDGNRKNNRIENLEWATKLENERMKATHGTSNIGQRNGRAKLRESDVREIRSRSALGCLQCDLADEFGVSSVTIGQIVRRERWRSLA